MIKRFAERLDPGRSAHARRADRVDAQGRKRQSAQGDRKAACTGWPTEPRPDVVNLPNSMLIALAAPIRRALERPIVVTLQGEDLFLDGLTEPYQVAGARADSPAGRGRRPVRLGQRVLHRLHDGVPRHPARARCGRCRSASTSRISSAAARRCGATRSRSATSRGSRPRKGCTTWPRRIASCARTAGCRRRGCVAAGYLAPISTPISTASSANSRSLRARTASFNTPAPSIATAKVAFPAQSLDVLSVPSGYHEPKGLYLLEAMASACRWSSRITAPFPEMMRRTRRRRAVGVASSPTTSPTRIMMLWRDPARAARARRARRRRRARPLHHRAHGRRDARVYGELCQLVLQPAASPRPTLAGGSADGARRVSFTLAPGEAAAVMGPSGSGKSSLLYILGGLEPPTSGTVTLGGENPYALLARRARGVPQSASRVRLSGSLPAAAVHGARKRARADARRRARSRRAGTRARELLDHVGLGERLDHRPAALSGGEKQRVAIARALIREPQAGAVRRADRQPRRATRPIASPSCCSPCTASRRRSCSSSRTATRWRAASGRSATRGARLSADGAMTA